MEVLQAEEPIAADAGGCAAPPQLTTGWSVVEQTSQRVSPGPIMSCVATPAVKLAFRTS